jgi:3-isopropylmalate dehydrogenase
MIETIKEEWGEGRYECSPDRYYGCIVDRSLGGSETPPPYLIGVLKGEGLGPEVIGCALRVLEALQSVSGHEFRIEWGGPIGLEAQRQYGEALSDDVIQFCRGIFARRGAVLAGPGAGRFVYDLRRTFSLYCKLSPLKVFDEMSNAGRMKPEFTRGVDIMMVRENLSGLYQGRCTESSEPSVGRVAKHTFSYSEEEVRRILAVGARIALKRKGEMVVVFKESGIPGISALWRDCAIEIASAAGIRLVFLDIDFAAYRLLHHARELDVVVAPNMFGDVLSDLGALLLASRGLSYSGSFASDGASVFQTNHGSGHDLVGTDRANPVGQILSLAMLLRESFGLSREASLIEQSIAHVWRTGWRTADVMERGCRQAGTRVMGVLIAEALVNRANGVEVALTGTRPGSDSARSFPLEVELLDTEPDTLSPARPH